MPSIAIDISISRLAEMIRQMSKGEMETLLIEMDSEQSKELKRRFKELPSEIKQKKVLSVEEAFNV
ncbi:MAG: hypothetical protein HUU50_18885 [Candidatus Brocadiae bacterium]|nr:hypothetical protein [Candidatus Brocadiia bacterium]